MLTGDIDYADQWPKTPGDMIRMWPHLERFHQVFAVLLPGHNRKRYPPECFAIYAHTEEEKRHEWNASSLRARVRYEEEWIDSSGFTTREFLRAMLKVWERVWLDYYSMHPPSMLPPPPPPAPPTPPSTPLDQDLKRKSSSDSASARVSSESNDSRDSSMGSYWAEPDSKRKRGSWKNWKDLTTK